MSDYAKFMTWQLGCVDRGGYGVSHGDTFYSGLRNYDQPYPCPNGLPLSTVTHENCKPWRDKVEKAKAFIAECRRQDRVKSASETITDDQAREAAERIRQWANL